VPQKHFLNYEHFFQQIFTGTQNTNIVGYEVQ